MSVSKVYVCDCCGFQSRKAVDFNNAPGNKLIETWHQDKAHYCNPCIGKFNKAIGTVFKSEKDKNK
jgi:hypothetical protein